MRLVQDWLLRGTDKVKHQVSLAERVRQLEVTVESLVKSQKTNEETECHAIEDG
jgi:hypothetical protein